MIYCNEFLIQDEKSKSVTTLEEQIEATQAKISELTMEIEKKNGEILKLQVLLI